MLRDFQMNSASDEQRQYGKAKYPVQVHGSDPLRVGVDQTQVAGDQLGSHQHDKQYVGPGVAHGRQGIGP